MSRQDWRTPPSVFAALNERFGPFDCDVAADEHNHLCEKWIGANEVRKWGRRNWCNPPFGDIAPFVENAIMRARWDQCTTTMLTHSNCCSPWFRKASLYAALYLPNRRIHFWHPNEEPGSPDRDTVIWHFSDDEEEWGTVRPIDIHDHTDEVRRLWSEANGQVPLPFGVLL